MLGDICQDYFWSQMPPVRNNIHCSAYEKFWHHSKIIVSKLLVTWIECNNNWRVSLQAGKTFTFALLALFEGKHQSPVDSPQKGQWRGALIFSLRLKRLSKQSRCRWLETPSRSLWRHCIGLATKEAPMLRITSLLYKEYTGTHWLVGSPHKRPAMRKTFLWHDVVMLSVIFKLGTRSTEDNIVCTDQIDSLVASWCEIHAGYTCNHSESKVGLILYNHATVQRLLMQRYDVCFCCYPEQAAE